MQAGILGEATKYTDCLYYTYVIKSVAQHYYYKGHCADLQKRINEHNSGKTSSIRKYIPFVLVYVEEFETRAEAIAREKYFKTGAGRRYLL
jgi:putative endonuclease